MQRLTNKQILLGVTGGIAAYKSAELLRTLQVAGAKVKVVMTKSACEFITPLTMQALSGEQVHLDLLDTEAEAGMGHIELARWADLVLIAPASANFMARLAHGHGSDLLSTLCLATDAKIAIAPAMNQQMWKDSGTQRNKLLLEEKNVAIFGPDSGQQACGEVGPGRMQEPETIATAAAELFEHQLMTGKTVLITAGPTKEALDPVRYISNHSSGKMGFALAEAAADAGAKVILIAGPVTLATPSRVKRINVVSALDMYDATMKEVTSADIFIATAAVADYRPLSQAEHKIKKDQEHLTIELTKNPDIVATVADLDNKPFTVGFAAETQDVIQYAEGKLANKKLDMIATNDVAGPNIGFNSDANALTVIWPGGHKVLPTASKKHIAQQLIELIAIRHS